MTPNKIKELIDQKIAGQGSMVDVGGALPTILKEIVDMAGQYEPLVIPSSEFLAEGVIKTEATYNSILEAVRGNRRVVIHQPSGNVSTVVGTVGNEVLYAGEMDGAGIHTLLVD